METVVFSLLSGIIIVLIIRYKILVLILINTISIAFKKNALYLALRRNKILFVELNKSLTETALKYERSKKK